MGYAISGVTLSAADIKLLCAALSHVTAPIVVDMDAAAADGGYTIGSFKKMWPALKKKLQMEGVAGPKPAGADGDSEAAATPTKTPGSRARARGRPDKKAAADGGPSPVTPGIPGLDSLTMADSLATPDSPSKSTFDGLNGTASSNKRTAGDAENPDGANGMELESPAKKKKRTATPRKPRMTPKQKREAEAAAAAEADALAAAALDETAYFYGEAEQASEPVEAAPAAGDSIDVAMEDGNASPSKAEESATDAGDV